MTGLRGLATLFIPVGTDGPGLAQTAPDVPLIQIAPTSPDVTQPAPTAPPVIQTQPAPGIEAQPAAPTPAVTTESARHPDHAAL